MMGKLPSLDTLRSSVDSIATLGSPFGKGKHAGGREEAEFKLGTVVILKEVPYKIVAVIASGGFSTVFRCADRDGHEYALKRTVCRSLDARTAAEREVSILSELPRVPGIVQFRGSCVRAAAADGGLSGGAGGVEVFALLTLCRGGHLLGKLQRAGDELTAGEVWKLLADLCGALASHGPCHGLNSCNPRG